MSDEDKLGSAEAVIGVKKSKSRLSDLDNFKKSQSRILDALTKPSALDALTKPSALDALTKSGALGAAAQIAESAKVHRTRLDDFSFSGIAAKIVGEGKVGLSALDIAKFSNISAFEKLNKNLSDANKMADLSKSHQNYFESNVRPIDVSTRNASPIFDAQLKEKQRQSEQTAEQLQLARENTELSRKNTLLLGDVADVLKSSQKIIF